MATDARGPITVTATHIESGPGTTEVFSVLVRNGSDDALTVVGTLRLLTGGMQVGQATFMTDVPANGETCEDSCAFTLAPFETAEVRIDSVSPVREHELPDLEISPEMKEVLEHMTPEQLEALAANLPPELAESLAAFPPEVVATLPPELQVFFSTLLDPSSEDDESNELDEDDA